MKLKFKIVTPERVLLESEIDSVSVPTQMGEITIMPNHIPLVANLAPGELRAVENGQDRLMAVAGGVIEVRPGNQVIVLADAAESAEEVDVARAEEAKQRAKKIMSEKILSEEEYAATAAALERSLARIRIGRKRKYQNAGKTP